MDTPKIRDFLALHQAYFESHESKFNILLGLSLHIRDKRLGKEARLFSFGRPGAAALQMEGRNLVLGDLSPEDCAKLASHYSNLDYPGVHAPDAVGDWFVRSAGASHFHPAMDMGVFQLDGPPKKPPVPGFLERAKDIPLLVEWLTAFHREADGQGMGEREKQDMKLRAEHNPFYLWKYDGEPLAMASIVREGHKGATIGAVYVPPAQRGHRYGEAVTAGLAEEILRRGKKFSSLYADMANPVSNKIYARVGYKLIGHAKTIRRR